MRRATEEGAGGSDPTAPAFVRRLGEAGYGPGEGRVGTLDLLARSGLPVPEGFVLTNEAHREFLRSGELRGALEREIRTALLELGARAVVVGWEAGARRGLGTIPAVVAAVREAWSPAPTGGGSWFCPVLVQRQARPELTGWTTTAELLPGRPRRGDAPLHDAGPGRGGEDVSRLTRRARGVLGEAARLGWGLEDGRWLLVSVEEERG